MAYGAAQAGYPIQARSTWLANPGQNRPWAEPTEIPDYLYKTVGT